MFLSIITSIQYWSFIKINPTISESGERKIQSSRFLLKNLFQKNLVSNIFREASLFIEHGHLAKNYYRRKKMPSAKKYNVFGQRCHSYLRKRNSGNFKKFQIFFITFLHLSGHFKTFKKQISRGISQNAS